MAVEARFKVTRRTEHTKYPGQDHRQVDVEMEPIGAPEYDDEGKGGINDDWSRWTPSGRIEITVTNDAASDQFKIDEELRVVFTKHQPQKARA